MAVEVEWEFSVDARTQCSGHAVPPRLAKHRGQPLLRSAVDAVDAGTPGAGRRSGRICEIGAVCEATYLDGAVEGMVRGLLCTGKS